MSLLGKCIVRNKTKLIREDDTNRLFSAPEHAVVGERYSFEVNEDDDAVDLQVESEWMTECLGVDLRTISFYQTIDDEEAETHFGTCDLTGMRGDLVPCIALDSETKEVVEFEVLASIVHSTLGKYAGAF